MTDIIKRPVVTEKSTNLQTEGKYTFVVARGAGKNQIKKAVEDLFAVTVKNVQTIGMRGKTKRRGKRRSSIQRPDWKKAIVSLREGERIELFGGGGG